MSILQKFVGQKFSLKRNLIFSISSALLLCSILAVIVLLIEFNEHIDSVKSNNLKDEAQEVASHLNIKDGQLSLGHGKERLSSDTTRFRYSIHNDTGELALGRTGAITHPGNISHKAVGESHSYQDGENQEVIAVKTTVNNQTYLVLVTHGTSEPNMTVMQFFVGEMVEQSGWLLVTLLVIVSAAIFATRWTLSPLHLISAEANKISPSVAEKRLTSKDAPVEVLPLINAVNGALDRLALGYRVQREFAANVAHETRTPIAVLKSRIDIMKEGADKEDLSGDLARVERIFEQLLDLSRADALSETGHETVDMTVMAKEIASDFALMAIKQKKTIAVSGVDKARISGNPGVLKLALRNLVENALLYTPPNSEVEIEVSGDPKAWRVLDRGPGIPDGLKKTLFTRFQRGPDGESKPAGSGIGLSIVETVAKAHQGTVQIEDRPGGGAILSIELPTP
jgi:signal transduction histidine kinase